MDAPLVTWLDDDRDDHGQEQRGIGARRAAERLGLALRLAGEYGVTVHRVDVEVVAEAGLLARVGEWRGHVLYDEAACEEPDSELAVGLREAITQRQVWTAASLTPREAADLAELRPTEFEGAARADGIEPGLLGRWEKAAVETWLAGGGADRARAARPLGWRQTAQRLRLRREREVEHLVEAGLLAPVDGGDVDRPVRFASGDVDFLLGNAGLDWAAARNSRRGFSPWRELAGPAGERDRLVAELVARLRADGVDAWARWSETADRWTVDWPRTGGGPTRGEVAAALPTRLARAVVARRLVLLGPVGETMHWAWRMLHPGTAVVVDTETTGLDYEARAVEVAVVDAATGATLLDTLVHPGVPIPRQAQRVHGITDTMTAGAPTWERVLPELQAAVAGRQVLAYNEEFDRRVLRNHSRALGLEPGRLVAPDTWTCLMAARSRWLGTSTRLRAGGPHRALGDALHERGLLAEMTRRPEWTRDLTGRAVPAIDV
ncbi:DNA polymerase III, epsilon subunit [Streptomyces zhaozhouensis]|uniref:DNA polymerase III, epsilon subunit n=1 Tax=Streptomyces zhaozhouensis TaxID=1300267 RepID=A0A286E7X4_9ACTN|nr:3'-5' exonuclease [Streptomyces zhaozhouensis]SOD66954.1 DNA polymerase III, epsilon subunit [Streptomyces zhaozhouensis]